MQRNSPMDSFVVGHVNGAITRERVVLVASGKGGVGTSVVASLLSLVCASQGANVLLVDGNEGNGALHMLFGVRPTHSLDALRDPAVSIDDVIIPLADQFSLIANRPAQAEQTAVSLTERRAPFERVLPLSNEYDCIIVDAGARLDNVMAITQSGAATALVVTDADRVSLASNYALLKVLAERAPDVRCRVLVNRHDDSIAQAASGRLSEACMRFLDHDVEPAGSLPDDACLRAALGAGMPIGDAAHDSPAARAMLPVVRHVLPGFAAERVAAGAGIPQTASWS